MKKIIPYILMALLLINLAPITSLAATEPPAIIAETAIVIDANTGKVLYDKNMNDQRYPASTTKVITALLALDNLDLSKTVTIDAETPFTEGSRVYLLEGERVTVEQILYALLLESANDAAVALGKEIAGSIPAFAEMMNQKAVELGAKNTNFVNPNGLHDDNHLSTAYDLAMIAKEAMKNEKFRELVTTYRYVIPATNMQETRYLYNTNRLIYDEITKVTVNGAQRAAKYEGSTGIKTGYTSKAGGCLIAGAKRGDTELISVVMKSTDEGRFADSIALLDYAFDNYKSVKVMDEDTVLGEIQVKRGAINRVEVVAGETGYTTLPVEASSSLANTKVILDKKVRAPVESGQKVGVVEIYEGETLVGSIDAIAASEIAEGGVLSIIGISDNTAKVIERIFASILILIVLLFAAYVILKRRQIRKRRQRRLERARRYENYDYNNNRKRYDEHWRG
ncbi:MAG: D-alanyl-D-alanine carboxypeptidase [Syntrophomonas sp.]|nr:D-alanyl-D-alanine carboxypeptidase [Eubacteriales bacterium]MDD3199844.1 D-alanyl-D-alanine carboxypeptidase [Eubacteriales bacterium]MDD3880275.1 D-alanyl-D-alanine carboxypeptidase [Syntrophomonas sp.]MDD4630124.1 D-alanyl-D-alanine carboxypeptidase [Eubacteriales bacterium]